jgi:hypothetical protein
MEAQTGTEYEDNAEPMLLEQFQIAIERTQIRSEELIAACKAVLVESKKASEVAQELGLDSAHVRRAVITIREKWQEICVERGWQYLPIALPHSSMQLVLKMQQEHLDAYRAGTKGEPRRRRKRKKK